MKSTDLIMVGLLPVLAVAIALSALNEDAATTIAASVGFGFVLARVCDIVLDGRLRGRRER